MRLSRAWLQDYIDISDISNDELKNKITLHIAEVEEFGRYKSYLDTVVLGKFEKITKHPSRDELSVAKVNIGKKSIQIVFTNKFTLKVGKCYPIALPGTQLPGGTIDVQDVQGETSEGMVCSNDELDLPYNRTGLIELDGDVAGNTLPDILMLIDDYIEIDNKSITHRPDLWSHYGFARDLSAVLNRPMKKIIDFPALQDDTVVVGRVETIEHHPDAEKLHVTEVNIGKERLQIVCGAPDLKNRQISPVAQLGATLPNGLTLKPIQLRGVESRGMLCSSDELCVPKTESVIVTFPELDDSYLGKSLNEIYFPSFATRSTFPIRIEDYALCPKYLGAEFENIVITESPTWLKARILVAGMRPINSIVDSTNYVLLDIGQPTHAFDIDLLKHKEIVVRTARKGEKFTTLDSIERTLHEDDVVITNGKEPVALAGIMGGEESEIRSTTTHILIESATFNAINVRMTSQRQQLRTEAVQRFEKFPDTRLAEKALDMIVTMISELHPEANFKGISFDQKIETLVTEPIQFNYKELLEYGGMPMSPKEATGILERLDFKVAFNKENGTISATKPLFRSKQDISIKQDVIEEILRVFGYYKIKPRKPIGEIALPPKNPVTHLKWELSDELIGKGFIEVRNYTFLSSDILEEFGFSDKPAFKNPVSDQMNSLRPTLVPHLLQTMENNLVLAGDEQRYFEIGTIVDPNVPGETRMPNSDTFLPYQPTVIGGLYYSKMKHPLLQLKDIISNGLKENGYTEILLEAMNEKHSYLHPFQSYWIIIDGTNVGYIGSLHPEILQKHKLSGYHTTVFEIDLFKLAGVRKIQKTYVATSKFPPIKRDYAFIAPGFLAVNTMLATIRSVDEMIAEAYVFDVYRGKNLPENTKSVAIRIFYSDFNKTLKEENIEIIEKKLISAMQNAGCEQR